MADGPSAFGDGQTGGHDASQEKPDRLPGPPLGGRNGGHMRHLLHQIGHRLHGAHEVARRHVAHLDLEPALITFD